MKALGPNRPKTWWAWSVTSTDSVYYHIHPSRSAQAAVVILCDYSGIVICDGYTAYSALRKDRAATRDGPPPFALAHCWAHVRRNFFEAEPHDPRAGKVLDLIAKLYEVEAEARATGNGDLHERRAELREARSRETVTEIRRWMLEQRALPGSGLGKAIRYTDGIWQGLIRFLDRLDQAA